MMLLCMTVVPKILRGITKILGKLKIRKIFNHFVEGIRGVFLVCPKFESHFHFGKARVQRANVFHLFSWDSYHLQKEAIASLFWYSRKRSTLEIFPGKISGERTVCTFLVMWPKYCTFFVCDDLYFNLLLQSLVT